MVLMVGFLAYAVLKNSLSIKSSAPWVALIRAEINNQPANHSRGTLLMTNNAAEDEIEEQPASRLSTRRMPIHPINKKLQQQLKKQLTGV